MRLATSKFADYDDEPLLLDAQHRQEFSSPAIGPVEKIEKYMPNWSVLPNLKLLADMVE